MKKTFGFVRRRIVAPVVGLLRKGATPERIAWSLAVGIVIGINPLLGSTTVLSLFIAWLFRLNIPASQVGTHAVYPFQLILLLPFLHAGTVVFGSAQLPLAPVQIFAFARRHPWDLVKLLWVWEWHALVIWVVLAAVMIPTLAVLLTKVLARAMPATRHTEF